MAPAITIRISRCHAHAHTCRRTGGCRARSRPSRSRSGTSGRRARIRQKRTPRSSSNALYAAPCPPPLRPSFPRAPFCHTRAILANRPRSLLARPHPHLSSSRLLRAVCLCVSHTGRVLRRAGRAAAVAQPFVRAHLRTGVRCARTCASMIYAHIQHDDLHRSRRWSGMSPSGGPTAVSSSSTCNI